MAEVESNETANSTESPNNVETEKESAHGIPLQFLDSVTKGGSSFLVAVAGVAGAIGGALIAGFFEVGGQHLQSRAQFQLERQKFEFELIREALEVQPNLQATDQEEVIDESDVTDEVASFAQDVNPSDEETDQYALDQDDQDRQRAAKELEFYADIGIIQSLDVQKIREWATEREAELPRLQSSTSSFSNATTTYCFNVELSVSVYSHPSFHAERIGTLEVGDVVYATSNPISSYWFRDGTQDGNSFVKVALYDGITGWIPRFQEGSDSPVIIDTPDCPNPGPNAVGFSGGRGDDRVCYYVLTPTNLYRRPDFTMPLEANFAQRNIAYASYPFQKVVVQNGRNAFVLIDIFDGNQAWVPFFSADLDTKLLERFPPEDCERPS